MPEVLSNKRVAVYIDAENIGAAHAPAILSRAQSQGRLTLARCHGNAAALAGWEKAISEHSIVPVLTPPLRQQKNATDYAMVIDIVAHANRHRFDILVLASSDGDFTLLATHLRELGIACHVVCEAKAASQFRSVFESVTVTGRSAVPPKPALAPDFAGFRSAALLLLEPQKPINLSALGKSLKAKLGHHYPSGRLSRHLKQFPDHFRIEANSVTRLK